MDNWEIDDETMMKMYEEFEQQRGSAPVNEENVAVDFVPEMQVENLPPSRVGGTSTLAMDSGESKHQSLHGKLMDVLARRKTNNASTSRTGPRILCYCGAECQVVVCRSERNAGRRFYRCESYDLQTSNQ